MRADADLELAVDLLIGDLRLELPAGRCAEGAEAARLTALFDRQVGLIFDGLAPPQTR